MERRVVLLIAVSVLILFGLIVVSRPGELLPILRESDPLMVLFSIASYTMAIAAFALIWHLLLQSADLRLGLGDNLRLVFSSVFFNVVTPTASYGGEAVRAYLLTKKYSQDTGRGLATIVAHRIIGTLSNTLGTLFLGAYLIISYSLPTILLLVIALVTLSSFVGFLLILYLGLRIEWSRRVIERLLGFISRWRKVSGDKKESIFKTLKSYHEGLMVLLKSRKTLVLSMALGLVAWFFVNLVAVFAFAAVGGRIDAENFLLIFTFFAVARLIPTGLPEFVGSKEAILATLYSASGLPITTSVAVILLIRVATQVWMVVLGGAFTLQLGVEGFVKKS